MIRYNPLQLKFVVDVAKLLSRTHYIIKSSDSTLYKLQIYREEVLAILHFSKFNSLQNILLKICDYFSL